MRVSPGRVVTVPVFAGILTHPTPDRLQVLLLKHTREALRIASWHPPREFPRDWLLENPPDADVRPARRRAIEFLLG